MNYPKFNPTFWCQLQHLAEVTEVAAVTPKSGGHVQAAPQPSEVHAAAVVLPWKRHLQPKASPFCRHTVNWPAIIQRLLIYRLLYRKDRLLQSKASTPGKDILLAAASGVILQPREELPR